VLLERGKEKLEASSQQLRNSSHCEIWVLEIEIINISQYKLEEWGPLMKWHSLVGSVKMPTMGLLGRSDARATATTKTAMIRSIDFIQSK
jgi:hypothetical protein